MIEKIKRLVAEVAAFETDSSEVAEEFRVRLFGKKGEITVLFEQFKEVPVQDKRVIGQELNVLKTLAISKLKDIQEKFKKSFKVDLSLDLTLPGDPMPLGSRHPVSLVKNQIIDIFSRLGFTISTGPEIEDDWHVFSALNFPPEHPARDMQDTFFIEQDPDILLRTHTSPVQVRVMEKQKPPIRTISPGRVFRNEAISARSHCIFHQVEGLYIDRRVSFADLKQTLLFFSKEMFGQDTRIRLRPSFFPFTEPSAEMDVSCTLCGGKGCNVCKYTGWLEILGCGMVDPNVLDNVGIDSQEFTGFAFGMGIERIALLKFGIKDIRLLFENDVRFLRQFTSAL
ncbi:MAG: phenylalanine--tRNA ligase subunit alpha [Porphyromonadaceae bacterium]|nr:MAG: phenylalanine--tRNA ligase subunit alpha [Porphyromonadaceae bacterium]